MSSFVDERKCMVTRYKRAGYIHSRNVEEAILAVPREHFMDPKYTEYAYHDQPFPIPGDGRQTISAPYMYPVTYEPLKLQKGQRFLEIGTGSGYGAAIARELVGSGGLVVTVEINPETYQFARENLKKAGYDDVEVILGDGTLGYPELAPYDAVSITASTPDIPPPIYQQMASHSRLIAPVGNPGRYGQDLLLYERFGAESSKRKLMSVVYVPLIGKYGFPG
ncbi:protein-L-isoaspartate O-methyltransferase [Candidatus Bathyarchaeota archaeon]|nr:MAG: protein-L-isoaspartate O-methyltransferase [Candidatus Bathyarchaeota archaeon]